MLMRFGITLLLLTSLLASFYDSASAASAQHGKAHAAYRNANRRKVPPQKASPKVQQHFSFIPPKQPSAVIQKLQAPLQGRVVQQQASPALITSETAAFQNSEPLPAQVQPELSLINVRGAGIKVKKSIM